MIAIDDDLTTLHITRGDATSDAFNQIAIQLPVWNFGTEEEELYTFQKGDKIRFTVFEKKGYTKKEILKKEYTITIPQTTPILTLTAEDTKKFEQLNKKKTYWYDIVLNDTNTILGMDEDGAKKIIVYPESEE